MPLLDLQLLLFWYVSLDVLTSICREYEGNVDLQQRKNASEQPVLEASEKNVLVFILQVLIFLYNM